jgi:hypothetical protein
MEATEQQLAREEAYRRNLQRMSDRDLLDALSWAVRQGHENERDVLLDEVDRRTIEEN